MLNGCFWKMSASNFIKPGFVFLLFFFYFFKLFFFYKYINYYSCKVSKVYFDLKKKQTVLKSVNNFIIKITFCLQKCQTLGGL